LTSHLPVWELLIILFGPRWTIEGRIGAAAPSRRTLSRPA
jgi:hypothetical protein